MIIEFIGIPGAGKTALRQELLTTLSGSNFPAETEIESAQRFAAQTKIGYLISQYLPKIFQTPLHRRVYLVNNWFARIKFFGEHPKFVWKVLKFQQSRPSEALARERRSTARFLNLAGAYHLLANPGSDTKALLLDEGFVQRAVLLFASDKESLSFDKLRDYLMSIPTPDLIVHPRASLSVCIKRVFDRGVWVPFHSKSPNEIRLFLFHAAQVIEFASKVMKLRGVQFIEIDNNHADLSKTSEIIEEAILRQKDSEVSESTDSSV